MLFLSKIDLNCRFIPLNTRLNTLAISVRNSRSSNVQLVLLFLLYFIIFDHFLIILLPSELLNVKLDNLTVRRSAIFVKMFHCVLASIIQKVCYRLTSFTYINICFSHYPHELLAIWYLLLHLTLCPDVHPNPGPDHTNIFAGGFLSFCNWNLNTLSKDDFYRITLLQAHNTEHNYDIISLCETSLDDEIEVGEMPG